MAHQVFISYSFEDKKMATALCHKIEEARISCWMAPRDLSPGAEWAKEIVEAIPKSRVMILVFSSKANVSAQVLREVELGISNGLTLIPIRIEDVIPTGSMSYYLSTTHWIDMLDLVIEKKIKSLISTINTALGQDKPHEQKKYISLGCERLGSKEDSISLVDKSYQRYAVKYFPNQAEYLIDICQNGIAVKYRYDKKEKSAEILDDSAGEGENLRRLEMIMATDSGSLTGPVNAFDDYIKKIFALSPFALFEKCRKTEGRCMAALGFAWEEDISSFEFVDKGVSQKRIKTVRQNGKWLYWVIAAALIVVTLLGIWLIPQLLLDSGRPLSDGRSEETTVAEEAIAPDDFSIVDELKSEAYNPFYGVEIDASFNPYYQGFMYEGDSQYCLMMLSEEPLENIVSYFAELVGETADTSALNEQPNEGMVAIDGMNNGRGIKATVMITETNENDLRYTYQPGYNVVLSCGVAPKDAERYFALLDMVIDKDALRESGVIPMFEEKAPASIEMNFDPQTELPFTVNYFKLDDQYGDYVEGILSATQSEAQPDGKLMLQYGDEFTLVDFDDENKAILVLQRLLVSGVPSSAYNDPLYSNY